MSVISDVMPGKKILQSLEDAIRLEQEKRLEENGVDKDTFEKIKLLELILSYSQHKKV